jgi:hypothetical protein
MDFFFEMPAACFCTMHSAMLSKIRSITLLTAILWQSIALFGSWSVGQQVSELEQLIVHAQEANHHHHADAALHMEDDGSPLQHMHADSGSGFTGLIPSLPSTIVTARSMSPPELSLANWLSPTLEGPLRPPMLPA